MTPSSQPPRSKTRPAGAGTKPARVASGGPKANRAPARAAATPPRQPRRTKPVRLGMGHPRRRARFLMVAVLFIFSLLAAQMFRIQGIDAATVAQQAYESRVAKVTTPAARGSIVSDDGTALAVTVERRNVTADATATAQYGNNNGVRTDAALRNAAEKIAPIVQADPNALYATLVKANAANSQFVYLVKDISPAQWKQINALGIPGIYSETVMKREYPQGTSVAPLVGWVNAAGVGSGGVEAMENKLLNGTPGVHVFERDAYGQPIATGESKDTPATPGESVKLTIDNDLQWYASNAIAAEVKKYNADDGSVVVLDLNGHIKAAASYPSFDNNNIGAATGNLNSLPFTQAYEPGSTSKLVTFSALLQEGTTTPTSQFTVPNRLQRGTKTLQDSHNHATLSLTSAGIVAESSNIGTVLAGEQMDPATMYSYMKKFGYGASTGVGFPGESGGLLANYSKWDAAQRYTVLYGQGLSTTLLQQASVAQTIANKGVRTPLSLIAGTSTDGQTWTAPQDSRTPTRVVSEQVAQEMTTMMEGVVDDKNGTAPSAKVAGYNVAGKTGTADRYSVIAHGYRGHVASFVGFAPVDNPQYIVAVMVDNPKSGSIFGGDIAAPVFSQIMGYALHRGGAPLDTTKPTLFPTTWDHKTESDD
ncbi:peptidoglycan synthetase FtsI [Branchiibius hedensis]|uniref:Peptidoglycan synthetase FtsI n=1 Tax=Branchiibius hedensis TaxID=672460 RepID=A0A2Y8ZUN0_9MICO|nr:penicillin-binding protein 2 [Branchiibius hedensis]PWJ24750.1 peptidoglycan synthetase FtsI [Branchiibius hedensis]SSA33567.1 peptidoglycan synthetase FtsI [Branchiibius hedensis]